MKSELETSAKKQNRISHLFFQAVTYRVPLSITKIIVYADDAAYPLCPRCSMGLDREYMAFCDRCGQKLNWGLFKYARVVRPAWKRK